MFTHLKDAICADEQVVRLDVAVQHAVVVQVRQAAQQLRPEALDNGRGQRDVPRVHNPLQVDLDVVKHQLERVALVHEDIEQRHDVLVLGLAVGQMRQDLHLTQRLDLHPRAQVAEVDSADLLDGDSQVLAAAITQHQSVRSRLQLRWGAAAWRLPLAAAAEALPVVLLAEVGQGGHLDRALCAAPALPALHVPLHAPALVRARVCHTQVGQFSATPQTFSSRGSAAGSSAPRPRRGRRQRAGGSCTTTVGGVSQRARRVKAPAAGACLYARWRQRQRACQLDHFDQSPAMLFKFRSKSTRNDQI